MFHTTRTCSSLWPEITKFMKRNLQYFNNLCHLFITLSHLPEYNIKLTNLLFWVCFIYSAEQALIQSSSSPSRCMVYSAHFVRFSKHQKNIIYTIKTVLYEHVQCRLSPCTSCCCCRFSQSDALNLMVISLIFVAYSYLFWDI